MRLRSHSRPQNEKLMPVKSRSHPSARLKTTTDLSTKIEWIEADDFLSVVGSSALGLLEKALHDYLRAFVKDEGGPGPKKSKESWFDQHCRFLEENTPFRWTNSPVPRGRLEEINLSRNDFTHDPTIGSTWPFQSEAHFRKYPVSGFVDTLHFAVMTEETGVPDSPMPLKVTRENLMSHIEYVRQFCTFVDDQRTQW